MNQTNTRAVVETGFLTALIMVFTLVGSSVPFLYILVSLMVPITLLVLAARHGIRWSVLAVITAAIVMAFFISPLQSLLQVLSVGLPALVLAYGYERRWPVSRLLVIPTLAFLVAFPLEAWLSFKFLNVDLVTLWDQEFANALNNMEETYRSQGLLEEQIQSQLTAAREAMQQFTYMIAAASFVGVACLNYITCWFANGIMRRTGGAEVPLPGLTEWRMPKWSVYLFLLGLILQYWVNLYPYEWLNFIATNFFVLGLYMLLAQGLSCLWYVLSSYNYSKSMRMLLIFMSLLLGYAVMIVGMLDLLMDLRHRLAKRSSED
ncbi:YybS family protein [uncultured Veillonella sp.]|uniref:YybS family protein n=1 Tax=uncultured Veillonella sp. TaxID=159268 RepID=UPI00261C5FEE|nr:YybS family protein [uncultured Veillonella sp.]